MRSTYKQLYYINRGKVKSDGTTSIMCRITIDGKAVALSTGLYCEPEEWNSKKGEVKNNRLNGMLCEYKKRVDETYAELLKVNGVNLKIRSIQIDSTSSYRQSKMYHYYLGEYIRSLGKEDMLFTDITEEFGANFILYLKTNYPHKPSYRNHCLCWLKRLVYLAVDNGILRSIVFVG